MSTESKPAPTCYHNNLVPCACTPDGSDLLTPAEVAAMFRVDPKTVTRWANSGKLLSLRTLGGHRRFRREDIEAARKAVTA